MIVMKFGGASLSDADTMMKLVDIVDRYHKKHGVVVIASAMFGVTDQLFEIGELLKAKKLDDALAVLDDIEKKHFSALKKVMRKNDSRAKIELIKTFSHLENFIRNISKKRITKARIDFLVSFGERLSIRVFAEALEKAGLPSYPVDASNILATTHDFGNAIPLPRNQQKHLDEIIPPLIDSRIIPVVTGYIGYSEDGCTTTLGRGGSDLTATFLANFLNAESVYLWKDVPGFYDKDPKKNADAQLFHELTYDKAEKLAMNGAKVIYFKAIEPLRKKKIPLFVKSYLDTDARGTKVS